jgi:CheY-like chemotaxis protein
MPLSILLVDDDELLRSMITEVLSDAGFEVTDVAGPEEALDFPAGADSPGVLITDIDLGSTLNGFDVAAAARRRWPGICIILISGLPADRNGQKLDPRDTFLQKPFSGEHLLQAISELTSET